MENSEKRFIDLIVSQRKRSPNQLNNPFETDAEIIQIGDQKIALTVDTLAEEIKLGLFRLPETIGWLATVMSLSDLAAVGAEPGGVLLSISLPNFEIGEKIAKGFLDCIESHGTHLLGGDTNQDAEIRLTSTGLGFFGKRTPIGRLGFMEGDDLYLVGCAGMGNLVAFLNQSGAVAAEKVETRFRPKVPFSLVPFLTEHASAVIDTSDGLLHSLALLAEANNRGLFVTTNTIPLVEEANLLKEFLISPFSVLAGPVGDYGIVFGLSPDKQGLVEAEGKRLGLPISKIANATAQSGVEFFNGLKMSLADLLKVTSSHEAAEITRFAKNLE